MKEAIHVGLLGLGTVGCGVYRMIHEHQEELFHRIGLPIQVEKILIRDIHKDRKIIMPDDLLTTDPEDIVNNPNIDVVIEVMGGMEETKELILRALRRRKHVITANKDLLALYSGELLSVASEYGCDLFYEASVGGGIPVLRSVVDGLSSDRIFKMMGIVNGTTNFILTKMTKEKISFEQALADAQALGFAEADPTSDIEGLDAARKMVILSTLGFSMKVSLEDLFIKGISTITPEDIDYADHFGYVIKLIGIARRDHGRVEISVEPAFISKDHPLASVNNEFNAIYIYGEGIGETMLYGPGAGQLPTATAVVSDLVAVAKNMRLGVTGKSALIPYNKKQLKNDEEIFAKYFLRLLVKDEAGSFAKLSTLFAEKNISFEKLSQQPLKGKGMAEVVIITHQTTRKAFQSVLSQLRDMQMVYEIKSGYRVEGE
ncbi:homoserine dehydrogenase [Tuberibacillus calidus]|uniref:homoserine dehydrogenase n=1 Tax=Tuberibacillus calidus TaxID=340097 RepID=UPI0003F63AD9|nr:homoserine dehydrogenase [Tuberibacillus calidus]